ncbi:MAG: NAD-dependent deacylase [Thermotogae bacterium]|nr:NAD-dependent deacylase [Thermotogota bacterium]
MARIVFFTGAGVSAESGIPTFRGKGGLWERFKVEELATPEGFAKDPAKVWKWYDLRRKIIAEAQPNDAHKLMALIEKEHGDVWVITQNVDGLHRRAGSENVLELHGNIWKVRCTACGISYYEFKTPLEEYPPRCRECGGILRPDVVWFGEPLPPGVLEKAWELSRTSDLFVVAGTSALVYPAAQLPFIAKEGGAYVIEINPESTPVSRIADEVMRTTATEGMKLLYRRLKEGRYL